jgi:uncharacterized membrane protein (UPF0127 family)
MARLRDAQTGVLIAERVSLATAPLQRMIGYLGRVTVDPAEGLWFDRCTTIHTVGMRARIDVLFLDRERTIVRVVPNAPRNRVLAGGARAVSVLELAAGVAETHGLRPGVRLLLE